MPHVVVKLAAGRPEEQKQRLAEQITNALIAALNCGQDAISVAIEDVRPEDWTEQVYKPDIAPSMERLYKKPGYSPLQ